MSNVDLFIAYLSGELSPEEAAELERNLASNAGMKKEFEEVSRAYSLVREQLRKRDEQAFRSRLLEVMERSDPVRKANVPFRRSLGYYLLPLAGVLAVLLVVMVLHGDRDRIISRYYHPDRDPVLLAFNQITRGETGRGVIYFREGRFKECMDETKQQLETDPDNQLALLYYLLSSIEMEMEDQGLQQYAGTVVDADHQLGQSVIWYSSLAMIKAGLRSEAAGNLEILVEQPGPYHSDAIRLQKVLLK
jgi:tetratricopeptide (TPR) repeat protein